MIDKQLRDFFLSGQGKMSKYVAEFRLSRYILENDTPMIVLCLDVLEVPVDNMTLEERISYYKLFIKGKHDK